MIPKLLRLALVVFMAGLLEACGATSVPSQPALPKSPTDLPSGSADLHLRGPVEADISSIRSFECGSRDDGGGFKSFYASIYFVTGGHWYFLQLIGLNRISAIPTGNGYLGPGPYSAEAELREIQVYPGGIVTGQHTWGVPIGRVATLTVRRGEKSMSVGSADNWGPRAVTSSELDLWPKSIDSTGPPPSPDPAPDQIEHITGSWTCG